MPTYDYRCNPNRGGCGHTISVESSMADREAAIPKSCPECRKRRMIRLFTSGAVYIPTTLGSHINKQSNTMSEDEKQHLNRKHNAYKEGDGYPSYVYDSHSGRLQHRSELE